MSDKDAIRGGWPRLLGHSFEVRSSLPPEKAKAALRKQKRRWLDPKAGPRGWILGPFLCLQWSALGDRDGPLVLARIADDGVGSRVYGRAGLDLASLMMIAVIAVFLIFGTYLVLQTLDLASLLLFGGVVLLVPGAVLCLRLLSPQDADPLVRFIRRVLETPTVQPAELVPSHFDRTPVQSAKLNVNGRNIGVPPSEYDVAQAIFAMEPGGFLIINFGSDTFMQTALEYDRFVLEKCEGSDHELYRARGDFESDDVVAAMTAYLRGSQPSKQISWEKARG